MIIIECILHSGIFSRAGFVGKYSPIMNLILARIIFMGLHGMKNSEY